MEAEQKQTCLQISLFKECAKVLHNENFTLKNCFTWKRAFDKSLVVLKAWRSLQKHNHVEFCAARCFEFQNYFATLKSCEQFMKQLGKGWKVKSAKGRQQFFMFLKSFLLPKEWKLNNFLSWLVFSLASQKIRNIYLFSFPSSFFSG